MALDSIQNIYQDRYIRLTNNGESVANAISKLTHRYLDGKPGKVGKHILRAADRDIYFWSADFWFDASVEVFETEEFALALARYLRQGNFTRSDWLKYLVSLAPQALRRAIRYSQIFLFPKESRWKEIRELNLIETNRFSEFIDACLILQEEHRKLESFIKTIEAELKRITPMETLVYASLFAFKHLVFNQGRQALRPDLLDIHQADKNRDYFQRMTDAINQILMSKLKKSLDKDF